MKKLSERILEECTSYSESVLFGVDFVKSALEPFELGTCMSAVGHEQDAQYAMSKLGVYVILGRSFAEITRLKKSKTAKSR